MSNDKPSKNELCKNCGLEILLNQEQVGGVHMSCEHDYFYAKTQRMTKVRPKGSPWLVLDPAEAGSVLNEESFNDGDVYEFQSVLMTKYEIDSMPEFEGW